MYSLNGSLISSYTYIQDTNKYLSNLCLSHILCDLEKCVQIIFQNVWKPAFALCFAFNMPFLFSFFLYSFCFRFFFFFFTFCLPVCLYFLFFLEGGRVLLQWKQIKSEPFRITHCSFSSNFTVVYKDLHYSQLTFYKSSYCLSKITSIDCLGIN